MANYIGNTDFNHDTGSCTGVLVTNLGTPDAPTPSAIRRYLGEFLADPLVQHPRRWKGLVAGGGRRRLLSNSEARLQEPDGQLPRAAPSDLRRDQRHDRSQRDRPGALVSEGT